MADGVVLAFPDRAAPQRAEDAVSQAREAHLSAFAEWLRVAQPSRDDAAFEIEVFAASARQMAQMNSGPRRT
jgi:hypothetical protein